MSSELVPFDKGDEKRPESTHLLQTYAKFSQVASNQLIREIMEGEDEQAIKLVSSLKMIHTQMIGARNSDISKFFETAQERAIHLFKGEQRAAVFELMQICSMLMYTLHNEQTRLDIKGVQAESMLESAVSPIRVMQEQRKSFWQEVGLSSLLAGGGTWLLKDLTNYGINFGRSISNVISDPFDSCSIAELVKVESKLSGWVPSTYAQPTYRTEIRRASGYLCDALGALGGGVNTMTSFVESSTNVGLLTLFITLLIVLMTIFRILRFSNVSVLGLKFSGSLHEGNDVLNMIDKLADDRQDDYRRSSRRLSPRVSLRRHLGVVSPRRLSPRVSPRRLSPRVSLRRLSPQRRINLSPQISVAPRRNYRL